MISLAHWLVKNSDIVFVQNDVSAIHNPLSETMRSGKKELEYEATV